MSDDVANAKVAFLRKHGWTDVGDGMWRREGAFCTQMSTEGAFHLETIIQSLDQEASHAD